MNRKLRFICKSAFYSAIKHFRSYKPCGLCVQNSGTALRLPHCTPVYICSIWAHISVSPISPHSYSAYRTTTIPSCTILLTFLWSFFEYFSSDLWRRYVTQCWYVTKSLQIAVRTSHITSFSTITILFKNKELH